MQTRPDAATLLEAVATFLLEEVAPKLKDEKALSFRLMIAANLATIVATELKTHDERFSHEARSLKHLLPGVADESKLWGSRGGERLEALTALERELATRLRSGRMKIDDKVIDHLVQTSRDTLSAVNPRFDLGDEP
ncbi:MAG: hypothetical protein IPJ65_24235 [Archangiaceae bacterium]|nr:hypothetical protein [Archangiaceae bacterium]